MTIALGLAIVFLLTAAGFLLNGYNPLKILHVGELLPIFGLMVGATLVMAPAGVLRNLMAGMRQVMRRHPYEPEDYVQLLGCLHQLFVVGRRNGMLALEQHILEPGESPLFARFPRLASNRRAMDFLCDSLRPLIDGRIKPDQLEPMLAKGLARTEDEFRMPVAVLHKLADSLPAFGILMAIMGIIITMARISSDTRVIGQGIATALCGTFYGVFVSYALVGPMALKFEFMKGAHIGFLACIKEGVLGFAAGIPPALATEAARRMVEEQLRPTAAQLDALLHGGTPGQEDK